MNPVGHAGSCLPGQHRGQGSLLNCGRWKVSIPCPQDGSLGVQPLHQPNGVKNKILKYIEMLTMIVLIQVELWLSLLFSVETCPVCLSLTSKMRHLKVIVISFLL